MEIDFTKKNLLKIRNEVINIDEINILENWKTYRKKIEPWLSSIFQSEHLSALFGNGLTIGVSNLAKIDPIEMKRFEFEGEFKENISKSSDAFAKLYGRENANMEDDIRTVQELIKGLEILGLNDKKDKLQKDLNLKLKNFLKGIVKIEKDLKANQNKTEHFHYLKAFIISFASRTATRERLNLFTTNYDRLIEFGCDETGILILDRFVGKINPILRTTKLELDYHYNPPGIRGEPRYVEGVIRLTKLHGSIDWFSEDKTITRIPLSFGSSPEIFEIEDNKFEKAIIFPNSTKDIETSLFPYAELFREFSSAICRPQSSLVTYGYSFSDSHINRIIEDMLTIPSTHLVIISYSDKNQMIEKFLDKINLSQVTLLIGNEFGDLKILVDYFLPKPAIDLLSQREYGLLEKRGDNKDESSNDETNSDLREE